MKNFILFLKFLFKTKAIDELNKSFTLTDPLTFKDIKVPKFFNYI